jgi:NDP-sugar pyrophosphorylase family protein
MLVASNIDVIVLCAGLGKRLRPLTNDVPKALVPVAGRPLLAYHLEAIRKAGLRRVVCVVGYKAEKVKDFAGDGSRFDLDVRYCCQDPPNGTGGAVLCAEHHVRSTTFAVIYADIFFHPMDTVWRDLILDNRPKIVCSQVEDASQFGRVETSPSPEGLVLQRIIEKDGRATPGLVNAGLFLLPRGIFSILRSQKRSPRGEIELPQAVEQLSRFETKVHVNLVNGWVDIGSLPQLRVASHLAGDKSIE